MQYDARQLMPMMPKFDLEAFAAMQKANLETFAAAQRIVLDLAQTVAKRNAELLREMVERTGASFKGVDGRTQPQAYVDGAKAAVEKAMAEMKETVDLGIRAQGEVVDLFVKRATQNFEDVKALAA